MRKDGVDGAAADGQSDPPRRGRVTRPRDIMRDDETPGPRYIERAYSHTPAGVAPDNFRREWQTAAELSTNLHPPLAIATRSANGRAERGADGVCPEQRMR